MILTIDIGNTTVSFGGLEPLPGGDFAVRFAAKTDTNPDQPGDIYLEKLRALLAQAGLSESVFEGAVLSSVVPKLVGPLCHCGRMVTGKDTVVVTHASKTGLTIRLPAPDKVGRDRLVDSAWAAAHYPLPAVTVDMGTATTFNVISREGEFLGGIIAAGLSTGLNALKTQTAQLPGIRLCPPEHVIGRDTRECMLSGAVLGSAGLIDGITARVEAELGCPVTLIITGGLARHVEPFCTHPHSYEPDLMLKGLGLLYRLNKRP